MDLYRIVLSPAEATSEPGHGAVRGGRPYRLCVETIGRLPTRPRVLTDQRPEVALSLSDLPGGRPLLLENAPALKGVDPHELPIDCAGAPLSPVVHLRPGAPLPTRVWRATLEPIGPAPPRAPLLRPAP